MFWRILVCFYAFFIQHKKMLNWQRWQAPPQPQSTRQHKTRHKIPYYIRVLTAAFVCTFLWIGLGWGVYISLWRCYCDHDSLGCCCCRQVMHALRETGHGTRGVADVRNRPAPSPAPSNPLKAPWWWFPLLNAHDWMIRGDIFGIAWIWYIC